jgi:hypothetical protein
MGDQACDRRSTARVRAKDLPQEDPQRDQRRIDSVHPERIDRCQRLLDDLLRKDVAERQISVLKKLTLQKLHLMPKPSLVGMMHPRGLLAA